MSHNFVPPEIIIINGVCPAGPFIPGAQYIIQGLNQGNLVNFEVMTRAIDANALDASVTVNRDWHGIIDWSDCFLLYIHDAFNNQIYGKNTISNFIWSNVAFNNNYIGEIATLTLNDLGIDSFANNYIVGSTTSIILDDPGATITFNDNTIRDSVSIDIGNLSPATDIGLTFTGNELSGDTFIQFYTATAPQNSVIFSNNVVDNSSIISSAGNATVISFNRIGGFSEITLGDAELPITIESNDLFLGRITIQAGAAGVGPVNIESMTITGNSTLSLASAINSPLDIRQSTIMSQSQIRVVGILATAVLVSVENTNVLSHSSLDIGPISAGGINQLSDSILSNTSVFTMTNGTHTDVALEKGNFSNNNFNATRIRLQDETSVLVANTSDATKSGYVNALP